MCLTVNFGCFWYRKTEGYISEKIVIGNQVGRIKEYENLKYKLINALQTRTVMNSDQNLLLSHHQKKYMLNCTYVFVLF